MKYSTQLASRKTRDRVKAMVNVKLLFLGTAASAFSMERNPTAMILFVEDKAILLDCGPGVTRRCVEKGIDLRKIETLYISHGHNDHMIDITTFLWQNWLEWRRTNNLKIITQGYVIERIKNLIQMVNTPPDALEFDLEFVDITGEEPLKAFDLGINLDSKGNEMKITRMHAPGIHDPPSSGIRLDFHSASNERAISVCYAGDTAPSDKICHLASNCTYLIHEATFLNEEEEMATRFNHCTPSGAGKIAAKADVENLILVHYSNALEGKEDAIKSQAMEQYDKNVLVSRDLMEIRL